MWSSLVAGLRTTSAYPSAAALRQARRRVGPEPLSLLFDRLKGCMLGPEGERVVPILGSYGIGVEWALASNVETHHYDKGIIWPVAVAPFVVSVVVLGTSDEAVSEAGVTMYRQLRSERVDVLLDDRDERPGVKLCDVELIGIPYRITVGARGLAGGTVEVTTQATRETQSVPVAEALEHVHKLLTAVA